MTFHTVLIGSPGCKGGEVQDPDTGNGVGDLKVYIYLKVFRGKVFHKKAYIGIFDPLTRFEAMVDFLVCWISQGPGIGEPSVEG